MPVVEHQVAGRGTEDDVGYAQSRGCLTYSFQYSGGFRVNLP
jgi:hypothetical protein